MTDHTKKLSDQEILGLIMGVAIAATVPVCALMKALIQNKAVDRQRLKACLVEEAKLDEFPSHLKAMLQPIWEPLIQCCDDSGESDE